MRFFSKFTRFKGVHWSVLAALLVHCGMTSAAFGQSDPFVAPPLRPAFAGSQPRTAPQASQATTTLPPIQFNDLRSSSAGDENRQNAPRANAQQSILQKTDDVARGPIDMPNFSSSPSNLPVGQSIQPPRDFNTTNLSDTNPADSPPRVLPPAFNQPSNRLPQEFDTQIEQVSGTEPIQEASEPIGSGTSTTGTNPNMTLPPQQTGAFQRPEGFRRPEGFQNRNGNRGGNGNRNGNGFQSPQNNGAPGFQRPQRAQNNGGQRPMQRFGDQPVAGGQAGGQAGVGFGSAQPAAAQPAGLGAPGQPIRKQPIGIEPAGDSEPTANSSPFNQLTNPAPQDRNPIGRSGNTGQNRFNIQNNRGNNVAQPNLSNPVRALNASSTTPAQPVDTSAATALLQAYSLDRAPQPLPGTPVSMQQMLQSTATHDRARMVGYYWAAYRDWCKLHCSANYFNALKRLNGSSQFDQALLNTAKSAAQNEMLSAEIQLARSQSQLQQFIPGGQAQPMLPLPSDQPYTTPYTTHYEYYSSNRVLTSDIRNIATSLPKMLELVTRNADTVRASKAALDQTQRGQLTQSLQAAKMWHDANHEFIDSVIDYNRSIAAYSLNVMSPYKPLEQVASALTNNSKSNPGTNQRQGNQRERQATLPGFQQGRRTPSPDNGPVVNAAPGQPIQFNAGSTPPGPPQLRAANQSFADTPSVPATFTPPAGSSGFQTEPSAGGAPASFGSGFGEGFRR